jgi:hypothetical protein
MAAGAGLPAAGAEIAGGDEELEAYLRAILFVPAARTTGEGAEWQ